MSRPTVKGYRSIQVRGNWENRQGVFWNGSIPVRWIQSNGYYKEDAGGAVQRTPVLYVSKQPRWPYTRPDGMSKRGSLRRAQRSNVT